MDLGPRPRRTQGTRPGPARRGRGVTARAVAIGLALTPVNVWLLLKSVYATGWSTGAEGLFHNAVAALLVLALGNQLLRWRRPAWAFGAGELLTIYVMMVIGTGLMSSVWDVGGAVAGAITYPFRFATDENHWRDLLWPVLPPWLTVRDRDIIAGFYAGDSNPYDPAVVTAWAGPALWWAALVGAMMWVCLCLNSIVRRRWEDEEKLPFPFTILPVQLVERRFGLLQSKLFWLGLGLAAGLGVWNMLASRVFPSLFAIPTYLDFTAYVANRQPWNFLRYTDLRWGPWEIGLAYLMPLDLTLSLILMNLVWDAEHVLSGYFGWSVSQWGGFPYADRQASGGLIALCLVVLWLDRRYLAQVMRRALGLSSTIRDDREEGLSYRTAVLGAVAGIGFLWWALGRGGMQGWAAVSLLVTYFLISLVLSRVRAQLGPPSHELREAMPDVILYTVAGTRALAPRSLGMLALLRPYLWHQRNTPVPAQLEGMKMAEGGVMERRRLAAAMAVVVPLAVLSYFWASLHLGYRMGVGTGKVNPLPGLLVPRAIAQGLDFSLRYPTPTDTSGTAAIGVGAIVTVLLMWLKLRYQWWPIHPVAYPISLGWVVHGMLPAMLVTWVLKGMLLHYGGLRAHRTALPFFLGLLAGSAAVYWLPRVTFLLLGLPP